MRILSAILSLSLLLLLAREAVLLYRRTVCRQEAWRTSVTLHTRSLLSTAPESEAFPFVSCKVLVRRSRGKVSWLRGGKPHSLPLGLRGKL